VTTVVTGATGHLGAALVRALLAEGRRVRAVNREPGASLAGLDVEFVAADVLDVDAMRGAFAGADVVYHLAGRISIAGDPDGQVRATNVDGARHSTVAALDAGVERFVHCSSIHAFDIASDTVITEASPRAVATHLPAYDRSKAAGEREVRAAVARGLDAVITNPTGVIGPFDFAPSRMGAVFLALARRRLPALVAGGFDWVDVRDVADGMIAAEQRGRTGENYVLGGRRLAVRELAQLATAATGVRVPRFDVPRAIASAAAPAGLRWAGWRGTQALFTPESLRTLGADPIVSSAKAARELGYTARPTSETVADLYDWFSAAGMLARDGDRRAPGFPLRA
jgi:dihydroflavonol-4-reductase